MDQFTVFLAESHQPGGKIIHTIRKAPPGVDEMIVNGADGHLRNDVAKLFRFPETETGIKDHRLGDTSFTRGDAPAAVAVFPTTNLLFNNHCDTRCIHGKATS